jgi:magnesium chelatase family protein
MATNPCPCGNLGKQERVCVCSRLEIERYWRKIGGALMDRIDIRVMVKPVPINQMVGTKGETSQEVRERVVQALARQKDRHKGLPFTWNSRITPGYMDRCCTLDKTCNLLLAEAVQKLSLSSRACHSILKIARTIADLDDSEQVKEVHVLEAVQHRRFGEEDQFWSGCRVS